MRINRFVAAASGLSRRKADEAIAAGKVTVNGQPGQQGQEVSSTDVVALEGHALHAPVSTTTIMLNKPVGFVVSRQGQGSRTVYDLLPPEYRGLKPVGRLDKDSSGLLLLTNDGDLAYELTHPSKQKEKIYQIVLDKPLDPTDKAGIEQGVALEDGPSQLHLEGNGPVWTITMHEGRNRQIRRTFAALNYTVVKLHRTHFGGYKLGQLPEGQILPLPQAS